MKNNFIYLLLCLLPILSFSQKPVFHQPQQLQADFDTLRHALEEAHGGLYRFSDKASWDKRFDSYRKQLDKPMSQQAFISLVAELVAETRDGHMRLDYDEATTAAISQAKLFPLRLMIERERLMVLFNDTPDDATIQPGLEIIGINGRTAKELIQTLKKKIAGDGFIETGKTRRLERSFATTYWLFADQSAIFCITAKDSTAKTITATLTGVLNTERENNRSKNPVNEVMLTNVARLNQPKENISLKFIDGADIAAIRIRSFDGQEFTGRIDSVFKVLHDKKTKALILDLRGNGGGVEMFGASLVSQFTNKPFRYFDHIHLTTTLPSFDTWRPHTSVNLKKNTVADPAGGYLLTAKQHPGVEEQKPSLYPFTGKLIVLTDGITFSTSADVSALLRYLTKAIFVGEETGGTCEGNTSGLNAVIKLPNSKLSLKIHMYGFWNAVSNCEKGRGILPDYPVEKKVTGLLRTIDPQWDRAVELAQQN
jgi:hypothetical protein